MKNKTVLTKLKETINLMVQHGASEEDIPAIMVHIDNFFNEEKEQIKNSFIDGMKFIPVDSEQYNNDAENYYNNTY